MVTRLNRGLNTAQYQPATPPNQPELLPAYLRDEFDKIAGAIGLLSAGHIDVTYVAPKKPRAGDIRYASGTTWNPGSGEGVYRYSLAGTWVLLG